MSNSNAYTFNINPIGSGIDENGAIHQTSPAWVLTFLRWSVRDTLRTTPTNGLNFQSVSPPLVVENDCLNCSTADSKGVLTPTMNANLIITDVNYETAINPGDFVFVNMLNWEDDARRVATQARNLQPINGPKDGFKGYFKIQSVRKSLVIVDQERGTKAYLVKITGFAFTEFNNSIYFNPYLIDNKMDQNLALYAADVAKNWAGLVSQKGLTNVQDIMRALIETFIGSGVGDSGRKDAIQLVRTANLQFYIPQGVGQLLGVSGMTAAKDAYTYLFGIQQYAPGPVQSLATGMNPVSAPTPEDTRFIYTSQKCEGDAISKVEYWNNVKLWSILNQFSNSPINELYTCFKITKNNRVMPTLVFRQIPFTNDNFQANNGTVTRFMSLPRWKPDTALATSFDLGRDEAARINFVQYFGRSTIGPDGLSISDEIAHKNYVFDSDDVKRNGLRPYITSSLFDEPAASRGTNAFRSPEWAKIVGDALVGGQLKMSGTINFVGLVDPIAVGDNLEFDSVVYHIESVTHQCSYDARGTKSFLTTVAVSNGISTDSNSTNLRYDEMDYGSAYDARKDDYQSEALLPGISESQDTIYRPNDPDYPAAGSSSFVQPNVGFSDTKTGRDQ